VFNPEVYVTFDCTEKLEILKGLQKNLNLIQEVELIHDSKKDEKLPTVPVFERVQDDTGKIHFLESHEIVDDQYDEDGAFDCAVVSQNNRSVDSDTIDIHDIVQLKLGQSAWCESEEYQKMYWQYDAFLETLVDGMRHAARGTVNDEQFSARNTVSSKLNFTDESGVSRCQSPRFDPVVLWISAWIVGSLARGRGSKFGMDNVQLG